MATDDFMRCQIIALENQSAYHDYVLDSDGNILLRKDEKKVSHAQFLRNLFLSDSVLLEESSEGGSWKREVVFPRHSIVRLDALRSIETKCEIANFSIYLNNQEIIHITPIPGATSGSSSPYWSVSIKRVEV